METSSVTFQAGKACGESQYKFGIKKDITTAKTNKIESIDRPFNTR